jgi:hypothetical protein
MRAVSAPSCRQGGAGVGEGWIRALSALSFRQGDAGVGEGWIRALSALGWRVFPVEEEGVGVGEE